MVDKELIKQRKSQYGDNFVAISTRFSKYLGKEINSADVCNLMALMKDARIEAIREKLSELDVFDDKKKIANLEASLADSIDDKDNYTFIGENYQEYLEL